MTKVTFKRKSLLGLTVPGALEYITGGEAWWQEVVQTGAESRGSYLQAGTGSRASLEVDMAVYSQSPP